MEQIIEKLKVNMGWTELLLTREEFEQAKFYNPSLSYYIISSNLD